VNDFVIALAGGAVGTLLVGTVVAGVRILAAWRDLDVHDREVREHDEDLAQRVVDDHIRLKRRLDKIRGQLNARNLLYSGEYGRQIGEEKEHALQLYRDQERAAERTVAVIADREGWLHQTFRGWRDQPLPELTAPRRVETVLDAWRAPPTKHLSSSDVAAPLRDPTRRTLEETLAEVDESIDDFL
jgi:hypothetical protein